MMPRTIVTVLVLATLATTGCSRRGSSSSDEVDPWSSASVGSVFETKTVTRLEQPFEHQTETTLKQTLVAKNDLEATVKLEIAEGSAVSTMERKIPLRHGAQPVPSAAKVTTSTEKCTVEAGTFDCTRTSMEVHQGDATRSTVTWMAPTIPVPIKSVVKNENMTTTTELIRFARG